jgi:hypothetical protein
MITNNLKVLNDKAIIIKGKIIICYSLYNNFKNTIDQNHDRQ